MNAQLITRSRLGFSGAILALVGTGALIQACSSDEDPAPSQPIVTGGTGGGGNGGSAGSAGSAGSGGSTGGTAGAAGDAGSDGSAGTGGVPACVPVDAGTPGCIPCPSSSLDFLNQCTRSTCARFDNTKIVGFDGGLPPLP